MEGREENSSEIVKQKEEFRNPHPRAIYELVHSGAIYLHPTFNGVTPENSWFWSSEEERHIDAFVIDLDKAVAVLETIPADPLPEISQQEYEKIFAQAKDAFRHAVGSLVKNGDLPVELALSVGRLIRPPDIRITEEDYARFLYLEDTFPEDPKARGDLELGIKYILNQVEPFKKMLEQNGVTLPDEKVIDLILREGISHEYGHAVDGAVRLLIWERHVMGLPQGQEPDLYKDYYPIRKTIYDQVYEVIAPNPELSELLASEPNESNYTARADTTSERIGRGFQYLGYKYALKDFGVDDEKTDQIVETLRQNHRQTLGEYKKAIKESRGANLSMHLLGNAITDVILALRDKKERLDLAEKLGFGFSSRDLGYFFGLSQQEIRNFISTFWPPIELTNSEESSKI